MNSSVLRKGVEDRPEEALAEVRTDEEAEEAEEENSYDRKEKKRQVLALVEENLRTVYLKLNEKRKERIKNIMRERLERNLLAKM